mmetsp:Transcript_7887/g.25774  ORF Transcript_7887/g.25774 Transcript_7887/m.25774 type:complete len:268 (-) Transcript_7887:29-832(-)
MHCTKVTSIMALTFLLTLASAAAFRPALPLLGARIAAGLTQKSAPASQRLAPLNAGEPGDDDDALYALGVNVAQQLIEVKKLFSQEEMPKIMKGIEDVLYGVVDDPTPVLQPNAAAINAMIQARMVSMIDREKAKGAAFAAEAAKAPGAMVTASGLVYEKVRAGGGPMPSEAATVSVHYVGTLIDGSTFDSSRDRGEPAKFAVKQVIAGWQEALQLMREGDLFKVTIPADIAYGDAGSGAQIPGGATICFEVELLKVLSGGVGGLVF